jgi:hypothetical protein
MTRKLALALALLLAALAAPTSANATFKWQRYNVDPFAQSREEAMEKREAVFTEARLSKACVAAAMQATSEPGKPGRLINGNRLDWMASSDRLNRDVLVALVNIDPGVEASPLTEEWTVSCDGRTILIVLPQICNNWSGRLLVAPKPRQVRRHKPRPHFVREAPAPMALPPASIQASGAYPYPPFPQVVCVPRGAIKCPN